jgi:hypothetical protein
MSAAGRSPALAGLLAERQQAVGGASYCFAGGGSVSRVGVAALSQLLNSGSTVDAAADSRFDDPEAGTRRAISVPRAAGRDGDIRR